MPVHIRKVRRGLFTMSYTDRNGKHHTAHTTSAKKAASYKRIVDNYDASHKKRR